MMIHRRTGDTRPFKRDPNTRLTFQLPHDGPVRWLPGHGEPLCIAEWISQTFIKIVSFLPIYTAIIVTLTLLAYIFGIPFINGDR